MFLCQTLNSFPYIQKQKGHEYYTNEACIWSSWKQKRTTTYKIHTKIKNNKKWISERDRKRKNEEKNKARNGEKKKEKRKSTLDR